MCWEGTHGDPELIPNFVKESHFVLHILLGFFPESDFVGLFEADGCGFLEGGDGGVADLGDMGMWLVGSFHIWRRRVELP